MDPLIIFLWHPLSEEGAARLRALDPRVHLISPADVEADPDLVERIEVVYGHLPDPWWPRATRLRWFQSMAVGVDRLVQRPEFRDREIMLTNTRGIQTPAMVEHAFALLLAWIRQLHMAREAQLACRWEHYGVVEERGQVLMLCGRTLGLLGVGDIGGAAARVGRALGMKTIGCRRTGAPHPDLDRIFRPDQLAAFLAEADVVLNTLPATPGTRGIMNRDAFAAMKPGAIYVNVGRGASDDTDAMLAALASGRLRAALLDVTNPEPLPPEHPLWRMPNVLLTSHYGGLRPDSHAARERLLVENTRRYLAGEALLNLVDLNEGY